MVFSPGINVGDVCAEHVVHTDVTSRALSRIPSEDALIDLSELFRIFGDSTRIRILSLLLEEEMCVCDIAQSLNMTLSAISHQLRILKASSLVKNRREGKTVYYSLADEHVGQILSIGLEHVLEE